MAYIKQLQITNCQSWANGTIDLSPGLNVFIGENSAGKSALMKLIKMTASPKAYSQEDWSKLIRWDSESAEMMFVMSDDSVIYTRVFPKRVIYYYTEDFNKYDYTAYEAEPPEEVLRKLQLLVEPTSGFIATIVDKHQGQLLVDTDGKSNNNLINTIVQNMNLDYLIELFTSKFSYIDSDYKQLENYSILLASKLGEATYTDTDSLKEEVNIRTKILDTLKSLYEIEPIIESVADTMSVDITIKLKDINRKQQVLGLYERLTSIDLDTISHDISNLEEYKRKEEVCDTALSKITLLNSLIPIDLLYRYDSIDVIKDKENKVIRSLTDLVSVSSIFEYDTSNDIVNEDILNKVDTVNSKLTLFTLLDDKLKLLLNYNTINSGLMKVQEEIDTIHESIFNLHDVIDCPFCGTIHSSNGKWIREKDKEEILIE